MIITILFLLWILWLIKIYLNKNIFLLFCVIWVLIFNIFCIFIEFIYTFVPDVQKILISLSLIWLSLIWFISVWFIWLFYNNSTDYKKYISPFALFWIVFLFYYWVFQYETHFWNQGYNFIDAITWEYIFSTLWFVIIPVIFLYSFLYFFLHDSYFIKISSSKKNYYYFRDLFLSILIICLSLFLNDISKMYSHYYNWYKNPDFFTDQVYICKDKTKLILDIRNPHHPLKNPHNNFFDFYDNYGKALWKLKLKLNQLHPDKINQNYLQNCISQNGNNYFDEYERIHWEKPKDLLYKLQ